LRKSGSGAADVDLYPDNLGRSGIFPTVLLFILCDAKDFGEQKLLGRYSHPALTDSNAVNFA